MSESSLVSVIIPIYNVAPYLRECLESVVNQTYKNLQIILINDGSTDESESIAREYLKDNRVKLISVKNGGLSRTRNIGLEEARGEYIYFIDSDDYIDLHFLQEMVDIALKHQVELVCNEQIVYFGEHSRGVRERREPKILTPDSHNIVIGGSVWRCLFSRALIEKSGVKFIEGKIHEDEGFLYMLFPFCTQFAIYCGSPYYYRQRVGSIMSAHKAVRSYDLLDIFEAIYNFYQENGFLERYSPPYFFLYDCGVGYANEREYSKRVDQLANKLGLPNHHAPFFIRLYVRLKNLSKRYLF